MWIFEYGICFEMQYPGTSFAVISLVKRENLFSALIVLFLSCGRRCSVSLYCGAVCWSVIVEFSGHIHLIFSEEKYCSK